MIIVWHLPMGLNSPKIHLKKKNHLLDNKISCPRYRSKRLIKHRRLIVWKKKKKLEDSCLLLGSIKRNHLWIRLSPPASRVDLFSPLQLRKMETKQLIRFKINFCNSNSLPNRRELPRLMWINWRSRWLHWIIKLMNFRMMVNIMVFNKCNLGR